MHIREFPLFYFALTIYTTWANIGHAQVLGMCQN